MPSLTSRTDVATQAAAGAATDPATNPATDPATTIDEALQVLFSCCLSLCRASRDAEHKDELIRSTIEELDRSIRLLRGTP